MIKYDDLLETQKTVLETALELVSKNKHMTIEGPAGTGKTLLTKFMYNRLVEEHGKEAIFVAAPTHQAKNVLNETIGDDVAATIHSILKINPETLEDKVEFVQSDLPDFSNAKVIICDEVSMYGSKLFATLVYTTPPGCSIIGVGDRYQISPNEEGTATTEVSKFFTSPAFTNLKLTEVVRNSDKIIEVASSIRDGGDLYHNVGEHGGVYKAKSVRDFFDRYFSVVKTHEDFKTNRLIAYRNQTVDTFNNIARKKIYQTTDPYIVGETLVMQQPIIETYTVRNKKRSKIILNNGENVAVLEINKNCQMPLYVHQTKQQTVIEYWDIKIKSLDNPTTKAVNIKVIVDDWDKKALAGYLSLVASHCRDMRSQGKKNVPWNTFWDTKNMFTAVKPLPACTIHKSQGTTVDNTFLYTPCMYTTAHEMDPLVSQQLKYVGVTRSRHTTFFI